MLLHFMPEFYMADTICPGMLSYYATVFCCWFCAQW